MIHFLQCRRYQLTFPNMHFDAVIFLRWDLIIVSLSGTRWRNWDGLNPEEDASRNLLRNCSRAPRTKPALNTRMLTTWWFSVVQLTDKEHILMTASSFYGIFVPTLLALQVSWSISSSGFSLSFFISFQTWSDHITKYHCIITING